MTNRFTDIAEIPADPTVARVYEHGWQSWSPVGLYPATATSPRPQRDIWQAMAFRPELPAPETGFQAEGLLAVIPAPGAPVELFTAPDPTSAVPSIRLRAEGRSLVVSANGEVSHRTVDAGLDEALGRWASTVADQLGARTTPIEPGWCSWYCYWNEVTEQDIIGELQTIDRLDLPVRTVQIDDGWQAGIGDWTATSSRFGSMADLADRITQTGRRAGIWTAPLLVGHDSQLAREHPDWLVRDAIACEHHWDQPIGVLDVTNPAAAEHLHEVFTTLRSWGYGYFKVDFLYAGAMVGGRHGDADPVAAYREAIGIMRDAIGDGSILLGCGAPILPSVGLFDAMRISPDVDPVFEPPLGDLSQPAMRSALAVGRARAFLHDRWWVSDPDCVVARPEVERRELWAEHCAALGGLAVSSDPLSALDDRGLEITRQLLQPSRQATVAWEPDAGPDQGRIVPAS